MKGLLLKDWLMLYKKNRLMLALVLFYLLASSASGNSFYGGFAILFLSVLPQTVLGLEERCKWNRYAIALPLTRRQIVLEKYLLALLGVGLGAALYLVFGFAGMVVTHRSVELAPLCPMLSIGLLFPAVNLPIVFRLGAEKARLWYLLIVGFFAASAGILAGLFTASGSYAWFSAEIRLVLTWLLLPVCALLFALSALLSVRIYEKKEL